MGVVKIKDITNIILNCSHKLMSFIDNIDNLTEADFIFLLVLIGQYLYAKYSSYGTLKGNSYYVYPNDIMNAFANTKFKIYARDVILLRNIVCHDYGSDEMIHSFNDFKSDTETLNEFLKYLFPVSPFDSSIGMMADK